MKLKLIGTILVATLMLSACSTPEKSEFATHADEETTILNLGDTAEITSMIGQYDLMIQSVKTLDEMNSKEPENDWLILVDYTITNTGDEEFELNDAYRATLFTVANDGHSSGNLLSVDAIVAEGPLAPGERYEGQFLFDHEKGQDYELIHNYGLAATEALWQFSITEEDK